VTSLAPPQIGVILTSAPRRAAGTCKPVVLRGHDNRIVAAVFSPDGTRVVTASDDQTARVWGEWHFGLEDMIAIARKRVRTTLSPDQDQRFGLATHGSTAGGS
jgi:hypothetical protein